MPTFHRYKDAYVDASLTRPDEGIGYGLALEGITAADVARVAAAQANTQ